MRQRMRRGWRGCRRIVGDYSRLGHSRRRVPERDPRAFDRRARPAGARQSPATPRQGRLYRRACDRLLLRRPEHNPGSSRLVCLLSPQEQEQAEDPGRLLVVVQSRRERGPCLDARSLSKALAQLPAGATVSMSQYPGWGKSVVGEAVGRVLLGGLLAHLRCASTVPVFSYSWRKHREPTVSAQRSSSR